MSRSRNTSKTSLNRVLDSKLQRRDFLKRMALTGVAVAGMPHVGRFVWAQNAVSPSDVIAGKIEPMIIHNDQTGVLETPLELLREDRITPKDRLYIRNNQILEPEGRTIESVEDPGWVVQIDGLVQYTKAVQLADLADMENSEVEMVLQCSGNGRSFYAQAIQTRGTQWQHGGMGNVVFGGVPLRTLFESFDPELGVHANAKFLTVQGADSPTGTASDFEHSVPLDYALEHAMLATHMNGEPIPGAHGGPVRFVIPGYYGTMNVKWVNRIRFDAVETNNYNQIPRYREPIEPIEPGTDFTFTFDNSIPNWNQKVKSVIFGPLAGESLSTGQVEVRGVAWNDGMTGIEAVQVSTDGGTSWTNAEIETPDSPYAWYHWSATVSLDSGEQTIISRAIDKKGRAQPLDGTIDWNPSGYSWNGADHVTVEVA